MRIAVIGAGGVGGAFGAALAKAGADVTFVARGKHLDAMLTRGLLVKGGRGETHLVPTKSDQRSLATWQGRCRTVLRQAVGCRKGGRRDQAADRAAHGGDPAAERH